MKPNKHGSFEDRVLLYMLERFSTEFFFASNPKAGYSSRRANLKFRIRLSGDEMPQIKKATFILLPAGEMRDEREAC